MKRFLAASLVSGLLAIAPSAAHATAISDLFNTGVDAGGTPLPDQTIGDPHYFAVSVPGGTTDTMVRTSAGGFPIGPLWIGDDPISAWIGPPNPSGPNDPHVNDHELDGPVGTYDYRTTFTLPGDADLNSAAIIGQLAEDDGGPTSAIYLNGNLISTGQFVNFHDWTPFSIGPGSPFVAGANNLDFVFPNFVGSVGLRVEMTGNYEVPAVPEPSSCAIWVVGVLGLFVAARRRRNR